VKSLRARIAGNPLAALGDLLLLGGVVLMACLFAADAAHGRTGNSIGDAAAAALLGWLLAGRLRRRQPSMRAEVRALLAAMEPMRHEELWLNRADHVLLVYSRDILSRSLTVCDEDDLRAMAAEGSGAFVATTYVLTRHAAGGAGEVVRHVGGQMATILPDGTPQFAPSERRTVRRGLRVARARYRSLQQGLLTPDRGELELVARQAAGAERIGRLGEYR
jgi:hypothetical protein